jgi:hypothetical protein
VSELTSESLEHLTRGGDAGDVGLDLFDRRGVAAATDPSDEESCPSEGSSGGGSGAAAAGVVSGTATGAGGRGASTTAEGLGDGAMSMMEPVPRRTGPDAGGPGVGSEWRRLAGTGGRVATRASTSSAVTREVAARSRSCSCRYSRWTRRSLSSVTPSKDWPFAIIRLTVRRAWALYWR